MIPTNPVILLSYINTLLRDKYDSLDSLCDDIDITKEELNNKLNSINYYYDLKTNQYK